MELATSVDLGSSSKKQVMQSISTYKNDTPFRMGPSGTITFFVSGPWSTHTRMAISFIFEDDRFIGREVGFEKEFCCSVSTKQVLAAPNIDYGESGVVLANIGDPHFLRFNLDPHLSPEVTRKMFDFQTDCLRIRNKCSSTQGLNQATDKMLALSGAARYQHY